MSALYTIEHKVSHREWDEATLPAEWFCKNHKEVFGEDDWGYPMITFQFENGDMFADELWGVRDDGKLWTSSGACGILDWSSDRRQYVKSVFFCETELGQLLSASFTLTDGLKARLEAASRNASRAFDGGVL